MQLQLLDDISAQQAAKVCQELAHQIFDSLEPNKIQSRLEGKSAISLFTLHENDLLIGFKLGYELTPELYYSWLGGVRPTHRGQGLAGQLMQAQHDWAKNRGYQAIETRTSNMWKPMLILNLKSGFDIVDFSTNERGLKIHLQKKLS